MTWLGHLMHEFGVLGVALGAGLEGETAVVIGGILARHGLFEPVPAAVAAALGSFIADQLFFFLGRTQRERAFVLKVRKKPVFEKALSLIDRHPLLFCFFFRFVYGFRVAGPIGIGVSAVPARLFVTLNALSAAIWASFFIWLGYTFGRHVERLLQAILTPAHLTVALAVAALLGGLAWLWHRRRREALTNKA